MTPESPKTGDTGKSPRKRRARGSLTPELILDAAEQVAAEQGFEALTMRQVGASLDAVPMALYNHFATKEALVGALLDRVLGRFVPPPETGEWLDDLRAFAYAHRQLLIDHPWAVSPLFSNPSPGIGAVIIGEHALAILKRGPLSGAHAVATFSGIIGLNYGWASFTTARALNPDAPAMDVGALLAALPPAVFPLTVEVAAELADYGSLAHYDFVLQSFLTGLRAPAQARP
jgi:AcrR family transcriptional regulator